MIALPSIVDSHHHLWAASHGFHQHAYRAEDYAADAGGLVGATVFVECNTAYDRSLPGSLQSTGETAFAAAQATRISGGPNMVEAIVASADPLAEMAFDAIIDAHLAVSDGRLRAIRRSAAWDEDSSLVYPVLKTHRAMLADPRFAAALCALVDRDLLFETWIYHHQLDEVTALARKCPECPIILNHAGTPLASGRHAGSDRTWPNWRDGMARLAAQANVHVKIGGFCVPGTSVDAVRLASGIERWTADALAEALRPWIDHLLACFGAERCLFESNFPIDRMTCDLPDLVQAYSIALSGLAAARRAQVFGGNAARLYRIEIRPPLDPAGTPAYPSGQQARGK
ncbi:MAG: amidohydrolase [Alphaproteobacteria bacterium]|nr:amidohydrolase [Alphaproteobacteria bacterium]